MLTKKMFCVNWNVIFPLFLIREYENFPLLLFRSINQIELSRNCQVGTITTLAFAFHNLKLDENYKKK